MAINHSVIGVIEGVVTVALVAVLLKGRPDVLSKSPSLKSLPAVQEGKKGGGSYDEHV
jgi:hypothetical protein